MLGPACCVCSVWSGSWMLWRELSGAGEEPSVRAGLSQASSPRGQNYSEPGESHPPPRLSPVPGCGALLINGIVFIVEQGRMPTVRGTRVENRLLPFSKPDGKA